MDFKSDIITDLDITDHVITHLPDSVVIVAYIDGSFRKSCRDLTGYWIVYRMLRDAKLDIHELHEEIQTDVVTKMDDDVEIYPTLFEALRASSEMINVSIT